MATEFFEDRRAPEGRQDQDEAFMRSALRLAERGPWPDPNPRVGCVVVAADGSVVGRGWHHGAGTAHAEVNALEEAGERARGGTAYVTLEPCAHTGRTGPCARALVEAGVARVVYAQADPDAAAAGGADQLRSAGVTVDGGVLVNAAAALTERWARTLALGRPLVTWKFAATLDGRSAAPDGSSQWITGEAARADVHDLRSRYDAVLVGTGTLLRDDPRLTVRTPEGALVPDQPRRVVVGRRDIPVGARIHDGPGTVLHRRTHDPHGVLEALWDVGLRDVWLEGGPTLAAAFQAAGLVDEIYAYVAPALLGAGPSAIGDFGVTSMDQIARFAVADVRPVGTDTRFHLLRDTATPTKELHH